MYPTVHKDPRGGHNRSQINQTFFQSWSPQMSYVLGFIFADGAIEDVQKSSRTCYIAMSSVDFSILEQIRKRMNSNHKFYLRKSHLITHSDGKSYISRDSFIFRIGSKLMYNDLLNLGVTPRKSLSISFPFIPFAYLHFFVRGYFDGDGCLHLKEGKYPKVIFTSGSGKFVGGLANILANALNIPVISARSQIEDSGKPCYRLAYETKLSRVILEFMYKDLEKAPYLERKFVIYQKYLKNHKLKYFRSGLLNLSS